MIHRRAATGGVVGLWVNGVITINQLFGKSSINLIEFGKARVLGLAATAALIKWRDVGR